MRYGMQFLFALALAASVGFVSANYLQSGSGRPDFSNENCAKNYPFINKNLDCDYNDSAARLHALDTLLTNATHLYVQEGKASRVSVWVRNLSTKQWAASNETELYSPASLLKLPLMISYYKFSELDPNVLNQTILYKSPQEKNDNTLYFTEKSSLIPNTNYGIMQLIERMITRSDNEASVALFSKVEPSFYQQTLIDLGIQIPTGTDMLDYVTVKSYSNIFRILYNASYLNRDLSQKSLELLTKSTFKGIAEPLPSSAIVAHKFGERSVVGPDGTIQKRELHDCGIVYRKKENPYALCIMTEGSDFATLLQVIQNISQIVYKNI